MDIKQQILHYYRVEELSLRDISRKTGADLLFNITGQSYRVRETQKMLKNLE